MRLWRRALTASHVVTDRSALSAAETATFATGQRIPAILRPRTRAEVQACLRIANDCGVPVHVVSRGKNWGYGSRVPVHDGDVIMDLRRMNRIAAFDERLGYVTIGPGVTFGQLHRFLRARRSRLRANPTASTPDASPLANALERGLGQGPHGDRFAGVCGFEVVLPTGECVHTGFARLPGAAAAPLHRWGVGPQVDGLFSQSNLGVVTQATLWLSPIPEHVDLWTASIASRGELAALIDALQPLFLRGVLRSPVRLANDYRCLSRLTRYPWSAMAGVAPLPRAAVRDLLGQPLAWTASGMLEYPTPGHRAPDRRLLRDALGQVCRHVSFETEKRIRAGGAEVWEQLHRPTAAGDIATAYWRKRHKAPRRMDPDRDGCGVIWCCPVVPLVGVHVARAVRIVERATAAAKLEPMVAITVLDGRTAHVVAPLLFDRAVAGEDRRAQACAESVLEACSRHGYYPYRLGVNSMRLLPAARDGDAAFRRTLKRALDPKGILSPGRYEA